MTGGPINRRAGYEFPQEVKEEALRLSNYRCEVCGCRREDTEQGFLTIHHVLPICIALKFYPEISGELIRSLANTKVLCRDCHEEQDRLSMKHHEVYAQALLASTRKLKPRGTRKRGKKTAYLNSR